EPADDLPRRRARVERAGARRDEHGADRDQREVDEQPDQQCESRAAHQLFCAPGAAAEQSYQCWKPPWPGSNQASWSVASCEEYSALKPSTVPSTFTPTLVVSRL